MQDKPKRPVRLGPVKWCKRCSRTHPSRVPCDLIKIAVEASTGRVVERWVHPDAV
jgi:hypothetical protein